MQISSPDTCLDDAKTGGQRLQGFEKHSKAKCPLISVVTVVYNGEFDLVRTIESVTEQTYSNVEYILVDGGSTDGTVELLRKFDSKIDYWISEPDDGIFDAMNKGINASTGEFIHFLNAGDRFAGSDVIEVFVESLDVKADFDLAYGDSFEESSDGGLWKKKARNHKYYWYGMFAHHQAMFFRREAILTGYDDGFRIGGDYALVARLCSDSGRGVIRLPFTVCIFKRGGISQVNIAEGLADNWRVQRDIVQLSLISRIAIRTIQFASAKLKSLLPGFYNALKFTRVK